MVEKEDNKNEEINRVVEGLNKKGYPYLLVVDTVDSIIMDKLKEARSFLYSNMKLSEQLEHLVFMFNLVKSKQASGGDGSAIENTTKKTK